MLATLALAAFLGARAPIHTFAAGPNSWLMDGKPYLIRSGSMHYSRVPRAYWKDRFLRLKAMGLNTVCTYVFWNDHEIEPGKFDFSGQRDVAEYAREAQECGLNVILRPGPYVCSEWEWGGFPYWLANIPGIQIRQDNPAFLAATGRWLDRLGKELAPLTIQHGGPIILCQVENEYGSFGNDHVYMEAIEDQLRHAGFDCQMYTADGSGRSMLDGGTLPDVPSAINFGGGAPGEFSNLAAFRSEGPRMNGEFWCGWFDHWGENHHTSGVQGEAKDLEWMFSRGDSVNLYMAHGGTTFGYMQGANSGGPNHYEPDTTSYDYDAPVSEDGTLTKKFWAFREVMARHLNPGERIPNPPAALPRFAIPTIKLSQVAKILNQLPTPIHSDTPLSFEELHHPYGLVVYSPNSPALHGAAIKFTDLQDRANVKGIVFDRASGKTEADMSADANLDIAVESMGRVNFSRALLREHKGLGGLTIDGVSPSVWSIYPIDLDHPNAFRYEQASDHSFSEPILMRGTFSLGRVADTYLGVPSPEATSDQPDDGFIWVNGHNLGRWDSQGPQQTLYCPACFLKLGANEIEVFHMRPTLLSGVIRSFDHPIFARTLK